MCFVDFEKAFDAVKPGRGEEALLEPLKKYGMDGADLRIVAKLYRDLRAAVGMQDEKSDQGSVLSPDLCSKDRGAVCATGDG